MHGTTGVNPVTVAPTEAAFASLPFGILNKLLLPENKKDMLTQILLQHVVDGPVGRMVW
jgi:uncharacterized surface protein with fasciclin (FAS1) repeats